MEPDTVRELHELARRLARMTETAALPVCPVCGETYSPEMKSACATGTCKGRGEAAPPGPAPQQAVVLNREGDQPLTEAELAVYLERISGATAAPPPQSPAVSVPFAPEPIPPAYVTQVEQQRQLAQLRQQLADLDTKWRLTFDLHTINREVVRRLERDVKELREEMEGKRRAVKVKRKEG